MRYILPERIRANQKRKYNAQRSKSKLNNFNNPTLNRQVCPIIECGQSCSSNLARTVRWLLFSLFPQFLCLIWKILVRTCCDSCSVVPIWVVSLYQMTWACGSACTTQINWASWPTPVCTNGRSTSISGGSINNRQKKLNQRHPMYHSSCVLF